jgi:cytochrome c oxidase subunit 2
MMYGSSGEVPPVALSLIGFQPRATPIREGIVDLHNYIFTYLVFIFFFVFSLFYSIVSDFLFSLRQPTTPIDLVLRKLSVFEGPYLTHFPRLEVIWTVLPAFVLLAIALPSFTLLYAMDEVIDPSLTLKALGHQWYWSYNYTSPFSKSGILSTHSFDSYPLSEDSLPRGGLRLLDVDKPTVLPSLTHVRVLVTSDDVLHSWRVPALGVKVDAVPGRLNQLALYARREGVFYGQCSELCGVNHGFMPIAVRVVSLKEYISWLKQLPGQTLFSHKNFGSFLSALPHKKVRLTTSQKTTIDNVTYSHYSVPSLATVFGFAPWTRSCAGSPYWLLDLS